jgi:hypothetical protein
MHRHVGVAALAALLLLPAAALAQPGSTVLSPGACERAAAAARGQANPLPMLSVLRRCGTRGSAPIAAAVRNLRHVADTATLTRAVYALRGFRDAATFDALMAVVTDRGATGQARAAGLRLLLSIVEPSLTIRNAALVTPALVGCDLRPAIDVTYYDGAPLPPDSRDRARALVAVLADSGEPQLVRDGARCVASAIEIGDRAALLLRDVQAGRSRVP